MTKRHWIHPFRIRMFLSDCKAWRDIVARVRMPYPKSHRPLWTVLEDKREKREVKRWGTPKHSP